jgi:outer membrane protein
MSRIQSVVAILLCLVVGLPGFGQTQGFTIDDGHGLIHGLTRNYRVRNVAEVSFADSPRVEKLMRGGVIYLSLRDAIALALENSLDIESVRYSPKLARADLLRASAGQLIRNVSTNISSGPSSASLSVLSGATAVNSGGGGATSNSNNGILSGLSVQLAGSVIPNLDPTVFVQSQASHSTSIETSTIFTGTSALVLSQKTLVYGVQQGYWTGTTAQFYMTSVFGFHQNATTALFNPIDSGSLNLSITQNLLNGFGLAVNKRAYHKALNNLKANDLSFKQQVIATVANVVNLYWDLVSFNEALKVQQETLKLDTQLYQDNQRRADLGAIAPIDIIQAEADMKAAQQNVIAQESQVLQQEMILKSVLTRSGLDNPALVAARIVPTDHIDVPAQEPVIPVQELIGEAMQSRPELEQNRISLENSRLDLLGTKNNLLPTLSANVTLSNSGQAGQITTIPQPYYNSSGQLQGYKQLGPGDVNQFLVGGYGTVLSQIFSRNFPNYSASISLTMPIRNRANQADMITSELTYRQAQIQDKQLHNNIKLNVLNTWTALRNARAAYDTSIVARKLQDETLAGTRRRYELGTSTILDVVIAQRDDTSRHLAEVDALSQYQRARTNLQQMMGKILDTYDVDLDEARNGVVKRAPDAVQ